MTELIRIFRAPLALLLAAALLSGLCGCDIFYNEEDISQILQATDPDQGTDRNDASETERLFSLSYYTEEALDPFTSSSRTNSELLRLCYSGLFSVDKSYNASPVIAESYEVDGNAVSIKLRSDITFSDGSPVTASDCESSYKRAAREDSIWNSAFSYILSYSVVDETTFRVVFRSYSPTQLNLLDIPIVRTETIDPFGFPVGCGRYQFSRLKGFDLVRSSCGLFDGEYAVDTVSLVGIVDREALIYNFNYGRLQAVCVDLSLGADEYRSDSELVTVPTNRLTFLVVNKSRKECSDVNFSKAITYLLDRNALVKTSLGSFGTPVWYPLNPAWSETVSAELNPDIQSAALAGEAFTAAGFKLEGMQRTYGGKPVSLRILVNRENAARVDAALALGEALQGAGFTVEVVQATWDEYRTAVKNMDFDLYLGEVNLPSNLDSSALFTSEVCNTGEKSGTYDALREEALAVLNGGDIRGYVNHFQNTLPFIPLYYSLDALAVSMEVNGAFGGSVSELYSNIENWTFS